MKINITLTTIAFHVRSNIRTRTFLQIRIDIKMVLHGPIFNAMLLREKSIRVISPLRLHQMIANIPTQPGDKSDLLHDYFRGRSGT